MRPKITSEKLTEQLNLIRKVIDKDPALKVKKFTRCELLDFLSKNGLHVNALLWTYLKDIFQHENINGINTYSFKTDMRGTLPIYKGSVEVVVTNYRKKVDSKVLTEESAIQFLKSRGYKISKPIMTYKEV